MKKGMIIAFAVASLGFAGVSTSADLNPVAGRAGNMDKPPCGTVTGEGFKKIWDNCGAIFGGPALTLISTDDGEWLTYSPADPKQWIYMIVKFSKAGGCNGTCYWQAKLVSQGVVTVWRWDHRTWRQGGQRFVLMDYNGGGGNPPTGSFAVSSSYFNDEGELFLLVQGWKGAGPWQFKCDVTDIHY